VLADNLARWAIRGKINLPSRTRYTYSFWSLNLALERLVQTCKQKPTAAITALSFGLILFETSLSGICISRDGRPRRFDHTFQGLTTGVVTPLYGILPYRESVFFHIFLNMKAYESHKLPFLVFQFMGRTLLKQRQHDRTIYYTSVFCERKQYSSRSFASSTMTTSVCKQIDKVKLLGNTRGEEHDGYRFTPVPFSFLT
jgi:hypothetical protein